MSNLLYWVDKVQYTMLVIIFRVTGRYEEIILSKSHRLLYVKYVHNTVFIFQLFFIEFFYLFQNWQMDIQIILAKFGYSLDITYYHLVSLYGNEAEIAFPCISFVQINFSKNKATVKFSWVTKAWP